MDFIYVPTPVEQELPPYPQIVVVLLDGRLQMMAQIRPGDNGPEWWTLGMSQATRIEEKKKCVTHWLKPVQLSDYADHQSASLKERVRELDPSTP